MMAGLAYHQGHACVSSVLAESVNTSPAFVRRILAKLSRAGLIETATGKKGACWMSRDPKSVSLLEIYHAVDAPKAFAIHRYPEQPMCQVSCNIKIAMEDILDKTQASMEERLAQFTVADVLADCECPDSEAVTVTCDGVIPLEAITGKASPKSKAKVKATAPTPSVLSAGGSTGTKAVKPDKRVIASG